LMQPSTATTWSMPTVTKVQPLLLELWWVSVPITYWLHLSFPCFSIISFCLWWGGCPLAKVMTSSWLSRSRSRVCSSGTNPLLSTLASGHPLLLHSQQRQKIVRDRHCVFLTFPFKLWDIDIVCFWNFLSDCERSTLCASDISFQIVRDRHCVFLKFPFKLWEIDIVCFWHFLSITCL
jgi:hypothetical protein